MKAQHIVLGITSDSFWFIGLYLIILGVLMGMMFTSLVSKKRQNNSSMMIAALLAVLVYFVGGIITGLIFGIHFYSNSSAKMGILLAGIPGVTGIICSLISFGVLARVSKKRISQNCDTTKIGELFSRNYIVGFAQMTMLFGLIAAAIALMGLLEVLIKIPDNGEPHLLAIVYFLPFILLCYLLIKIPKWFEKNVWTYAIDQQLVKDYPDRLKKRRDRNK